MTPFDYVKDGAEIYRRSFATIRREAELSRFSEPEERIAVRIIHACGQVETAADIVFTPGATEAASAALRRGAPILCDARMVAEGVTRARLPADNEVVCTHGDPSVAELAARIGNTRSAAALDLWGDRLSGALVSIGSAVEAACVPERALVCVRSTTTVPARAANGSTGEENATTGSSRSTMYSTSDAPN